MRFPFWISTMLKYEAGEYSLEEAEKLAADMLREMRYGEMVISGLMIQKVTISYFLEVQQKERTEWKL